MNVLLSSSQLSFLGFILRKRGNTIALGYYYEDGDMLISVPIVETRRFLEELIHVEKLVCNGVFKIILKDLGFSSIP